MEKDSKMGFGIWCGKFDQKKWTHVLVELMGPAGGSHMVGRRAGKKLSPNVHSLTKEKKKMCPNLKWIV